MYVWQRTIVDEAGNIVPSAEITVRDAVTAALVQVFGDYDGEDALGNPFEADANGFVRFYVDVGRYQITASSGAESRVWEDVELGFHTFGDVMRYGLIGDGTSNDTSALQAALNSTNSQHLIFPTLGEFAFASPVSIPLGAYVDFNGSILIKTASDATDGYQIIANGATVRNLTLVIPTGVDIERALSLTANTRLINSKIISVDQINNLGSTERAALNAEGDNIVIDGFYAENFDRPIRIENGDYGSYKKIHVKSYVTGLALDTCEYFTIDDFVAETQSANASSSSGHSGMTLTNPQHCTVSNCKIFDPSEHGIYLSIGPTDNKQDITFSDLNVTRSGNSGLKLAGAPAASGGARAQHITVNGLKVIDAHFGSGAGANEDGMRIEQCDHVQVSGYSVRRDQNGTSCYYGIYFRDSTDVTIDTPTLDDVHFSCLHFADEGIAETLQDITIRGPVCRGGSYGVSIDADTASTVLANIKITDAYFASQSAYAVQIDALTAGITQPIIIEGQVRSPTTGVYENLITGSATNLVKIRLKDAETHETATGTYTLSVYGDHSALNSSAGAVTATLPDGIVVGQRKTITMSNATASSTVSVTTHETSNPEVFTFNATGDVLILEWTGATWWTVKNIGVTT